MHTTTDPNSQTTTYTYDTMLRQTGVVAPDGGGTTTTYTISSSSVVSQAVLHATGSTINTSIALDGFGRPSMTTVTDSAGNDLQGYTYDGNGNASVSTNPYRSTSDPTYGATTTSFDVLGRAYGATLPDSSTVSAAFLGNAVTIADAVGNQRKIVYDGAGRIAQVYEPDASLALSYLTQYLYNQNYSSPGTYQTVIQQKGGSSTSSDWRVRTFTYDKLGRTIQKIVPETQNNPSNYTYSNGTCSGDVNAICQISDARSVTTTFAYDAIGRLTGKTYSTTSPATPSVSYYYDQTSYNGLTISYGLGRRTGMSDGSGQTAWSFDTVGRMAATERTINSVTKSASYVYNLDGTMAQANLYGGNTVNYGYNGVGQPTSAVDASGINYATGATYNAAGELTGLVQGSSTGFAGLTSTNQYNHRLQPALLSAQTPATTVASYSYVYGSSGYDNGNITQITNNLDSSHTQTYGYDQLNRLSSAQQGTAWGDTYVYDPWGNLYQKNPISGVSAAENLSLSPSVWNQLSGMSYDSGGNVTSDNLSNSWTYDAEGRVSTVAGYTYVYDGDGNRVMKSGGSNARTYWPGAGGAPSEEFDTSGSTPSRNVTLAGGIVAHVDTGGNQHYYFRDHLGSERVSVNASGTVEDSVDYYPWGQAAPPTSYTSGTLELADSMYSDSESYSYHTDYRQQGYTLGRWLRPDPYDGSYDPTNPQTFNRYSYVLNNPMSFTDPLGLDIPDTPTCVDNNARLGRVHAYTGGCGSLPDGGSTFIDVFPPQDPGVEVCDSACIAMWGGLLPLLPMPALPPGLAAPNNAPQVPHTCQQNRILNAVPGSTLTNPNDTVGTSVGGHSQFGINVTTAQLGAAGFTPFNPFGHADGYHNGNIFFQVHDNGAGGIVTQGHIDVFNPATGLFGFLGHSIVDVGIGTLLQHLFPHSHGLLDPGC